MFCCSDSNINSVMFYYIIGRVWVPIRDLMADKAGTMVLVRARLQTSRSTGM